MNLLFFKSNWEAAHLPVETVLERVKKAGFDGTEIYFPGLQESPEELSRLHRKHDLLLIAQMGTVGQTPAEHLASLEELLPRCAAAGPVMINSQTGRDWFSFDDSRRIFERALELAEEHAVHVVHETHRGRPTFSTTETLRHLEALPALRLTADISHWMCVHESDLSDQAAALATVVPRVDHIHARVGFAEGPQVPHPLAPEYAGALAAHERFWKTVLQTRRAEGRESFTITPEFGPPDYMPRLPFTAQPVADAWDVNVEFFAYLRRALAVT
jgi:sugar phosphate isomerase/epimerase